MKKEKWHYAVVKSMFGDYWVGKTQLPLQKEIVFEDIEDAIEKAEELFCRDKGFDPDYADDNEEDEDGSEMLYEYEQIREKAEESSEIIAKSIEKFIVGYW